MIYSNMDQQVWTHTKTLNSFVPAEKREQLLLPWTLSGESKSALRTGFKMGPFHLDAGHSVFSNWDVLLISHGHADHIFSVSSFFMLLECVAKGDKKVFAPDTKRVRAIADATLQCNFNTGTYHVSADFIDAKPDQIYDVNIDRDRYQIHIIGMTHRIPSIGYAISKWTTRLNPELLKFKDKLNKKDFGIFMKAIRNGQPVPEQIKKLVPEWEVPTKHNVELLLPQFCFLTDTSIRAIESNIDLISKYPIIIVECTFYDKDDLVHAEAKTHIHWLQIERFIKKHKDCLWVLIHSSTRYKNLEDIENGIRSNHTTTLTGEELVPGNCLIWV